MNRLIGFNRQQIPILPDETVHEWLIERIQKHDRHGYVDERALNSWIQEESSRVEDESYSARMSLCHASQDSFTEEQFHMLINAISPLTSLVHRDLLILLLAKVDESRLRNDQKQTRTKRKSISSQPRVRSQSTTKDPIIRKNKRIAKQQPQRSKRIKKQHQQSHIRS